MPGFFERSGMSPQDRKQWHRSVCLPLRIAATALLTWGVASSWGTGSVWPRILLGSFLLGGIVIVGRAVLSGDQVWWDRRVHLAVLVLGMAALVANQLKALMALLWLDLAYSVATSIRNDK